MREEEKAYLAGFLEADGCICVRKDNRNDRRRKDYYSGVISIVNTDRRILDYFYSLIGVGSVHVLNKGTDKWKRSYRYQLCGRTGYELLKSIRQYLKIKGDQADLYIELYDTKKNHMTQQEYNNAEKRYKEIKLLVNALNKRGP